MLIELNRSTMPLPYQHRIWGVHANKLWVVLRGGCSRQIATPDTVYGMVLGCGEVYTETGVYILANDLGKREGYWMNASNVMPAHFEQHVVFADGIVWLWAVLGACDKECLVPKAELFNLLPVAHQFRVWDQPWQRTATIMCEALAAAVARDEYAREV